MKKRRIMPLALALVMILTVSIFPSTASAEVDMTRNGLRGDYYLCDFTGGGNRVFGTYMTTVVEPNINWSNLHPTLNARCGRQEYVAARWSGWVRIPGTGTKVVTIQSATDDTCRIWLNNVKVVDWWATDGGWDSGSTAFGHNLTTVTLEGGQYYPFLMEYSQGYGGAFASVRWTTTGGSGNVTNQVIPAGNFFLDNGFASPPVISDIDMSDIRNRNITLTVGNFDSATKLAVYNSSDSLRENPVDVVNSPVVVANKLTYTVPSGFKMGAYYFAATNGDVSVKGPSFSYVDFSTIPRAEYPTPAYARDYAWETLNGPWDFFNDRSFQLGAEGGASGLPANKATIMVPFPWQSPASGILDTTHPGTAANRFAWYQRTINPSSEKYGAGKRVVLRFGAVDAEAWVYVNGTQVGYHNGGYTPFEFDITDKVTLDTSNTVTVKVCDGGDWGNRGSYIALIGKQGTNAPVGYTATSGIWQSVILEGRYSSTQLKYVHVNPMINNNDPAVDANLNDLTHGIVPVNGSAAFRLNIVGGAGKTLDFTYNFESKIWDETLGDYVATSPASIVSGTQRITVPAGENSYLPPDFVVPVANQQLWHPERPVLYVGTVKLLDGTAVLDEIKTHFGQRDIHNAYWGTSPATGNYRYQYTLLNNKPIFYSGLLDQGFWPDGLYTAPSEDALKFDITEMLANGFNLIRKHIKIEDPLQYIWADRLGMMFWQDMPEGTQTNSPSVAGRPLYENSLAELIERDYNSPSRIAYILFNETWGVNNNNANDAAWIASVYNYTKARDTSGRIVEDMSPCNNDHTYPTDMNSFHMYPGNWSGARNDVLNYYNGLYIGSTTNYAARWGTPSSQPLPFRQNGEPFLNSEFGGVASGSGDMDVSWCFKYQVDLQRNNQKLQGYIYTEPFDVEYERNGFLRYDRSRKAFGYDELAYGGDMSAKYLNAQEYVGLDMNSDPMVTLTPGGRYSAAFGMIRWSDDTKYQGPFKLKWRVDGMDGFGNKLSTQKYAADGFRGEQAINYTPYIYETVPFSFNLSANSNFGRFGGIVTVWIEDGSGNTIAKNFGNFKVMSSAPTLAAEQLDGINSFVLRQASPVTNTNTGAVAGKKTGAITFEYAVPENFDPDGLKSLRLLAELAPLQKLSTNGNAAHRPQTAENYETPSDVTVSVNGIPVSGSVSLPDGPNDIRAIMNLNSGAASSSTAGSANGGFGYLVNIDLDQAAVDALKAQLKSDPKLTVTYEVEDTAANKNGIRAYSDAYGRYAVSPSVILNPTELYYKAGAATDGQLVLDSPLPSSNYSVEAKVTDSTAAISAGYNLAVNGKTVTVSGNGVNKSVVSDVTVEKIRVTFFEEQVRVYINDNPQSVIDVYGNAFAGTVVSVSGALANVKVLPETFSKQPYLSFSAANEVTDLNTANASANIVAKVENSAMPDTPVVLIVAAYDNKGKLIHTEVDDSLVAFTDRSISKKFNFKPDQFPGCTYRVFGWNKDTFVPLGPDAVPTPVVLRISTTAAATSGEEVRNIIDNNVNSKWYTGANLPITANLEYSEAVTIDSFRMVTANDYENRDPQAFTISGSNDGVTFEAPFFSTTAANLPADRYASKYFTLSNPVTYKYYRLTITARKSGSGTQISEFNLIGDFNRSL
ncbi:hypothetical protein FACS1894127_5040 [Clostridia bacterium]|nr:hypothetical protein FACS1894127_5040 [Clostridia bacterium]